VAVAKLLGATVPWGQGISTSPKMGLLDMFWLGLFDKWVVRGLLWLGVAGPASTGKHAHVQKGEGRLGHALWQCVACVGNHGVRCQV
jgi:hypothetical protein